MYSRYEDFTYNISSIYFGIQQIKSAEMAEYGLSARHVSCLYSLYKNPEGLTIKELTDSSGEDKAAVSRSITALKEKGLVVQEDGGSRKYKVRLHLTEDGKVVASGVAAKILQTVDGVEINLSDQERASFHRILGLLAESLDHYRRELSGHAERTSVESIQAAES